MSLRSDSGTSAILGTINRHMSAVVVLEHFWRRFGLGTAVVPLPGMLGPSPPRPKSGTLHFFQDTNVPRQIQVVTPLGCHFPLVKLVF